MTRTVEAVYDGAVLRPETALELEPNTRVRLTVEVLPAAAVARLRSSTPCAPWSCKGRWTGPRTSTTTSMATTINPGDEVFLDTSYAPALSAPTSGSGLIWP